MSVYGRLRCERLVYRNAEVLLLPLTARLPSITAFPREPVGFSGTSYLRVPLPWQVLVTRAPSGEDKCMSAPSPVSGPFWFQGLVLVTLP